MGVEASEERSSRLRRKEQARRRQWYLAHLPWWRKPLVGYLLTLPLITLIMPFPVAFLQMSIYNTLVGVPVFLATVLIAWMWGTGPAIVAIVLGILSLNFFFRPPTESLTLEWRETLPLFPLLLAQLMVAVITAQRESARQQELQGHASELEQANQALEQANQALEQANDTRERFLSMASHELKTPTT